MLCHLNIGSNIGDSRAIIARAIALIERDIARAGTLRASQAVVSEPWGFRSDNRFINAGAEMLTDLSPQLLMERIKSIETELGATPHRNPDGSYRDRNIDIDIIHLGDMVIDTPTLTVPHPRMHEREFVLRPLAELSPQWRHPLLQLTALQLLLLNTLSEALPPQPENGDNRQNQFPNNEQG